MEDRQALCFGETDFVEHVHERRQFRGAQVRLSMAGIQQRAIDSAPTTRICQISENGATFREVEFSLAVYADEIGRSYNLQFNRHRFYKVHSRSFSKSPAQRHKISLIFSTQSTLAL
jgi:hypothetical protein